MATFRVHDDQENRAPELRQKQGNNGNAQQKRTVLGVLDNRMDRLSKLKQVRLYFKILMYSIFDALKCRLYTRNQIQAKKHTVSGEASTVFSGVSTFCLTK